MASKGGVIAVAAGAGLLALFAFTKKAKADTPGPLPPPEDLYTPEACAAYTAQRNALAANRDAIQGYIVEIDAAAIEAYTNGNPQMGAQLEAQAAGQRQALAVVKAQIADLNSKIAQCD